jgi:4-nitrophenyl phosphatase
MLLCVDLDGVLYRGSTPLLGVGPLLTERQAAGDQIAYITNNSFLRRAEYRARIESCGAPFSDEGLLTAVSLVAARFRAAGLTRILVYGSEGLAAELRDAGLEARLPRDCADTAALAAWAPQGVSVGLNREATEHDLTLAVAAVRGGARLIAPNRDATYPDPTQLVQGTGAAVTALETASGSVAEVVGKPSPELLRLAMQRAGVSVSDTVMIGDSPATDIASAHAAGVRSILMLTGVTVSSEGLEGEQRPTHVARDAEQLAAILAELRVGG